MYDSLIVRLLPDLHSTHVRLSKLESCTISSDMLFSVTEWSTTESSDDVEKQDLDEASDEEEVHFFDTNEYFSEHTSGSGSKDIDQMDGGMSLGHQTDSVCKADGTENVTDPRYPRVERRKKLPDPAEKEKGVSLWSMIKDNIGKDLTRVCLPVYFNEPISSLQKCFEDLEYSHLLDQAYEHGKAVWSIFFNALTS